MVAPIKVTNTISKTFMFVSNMTVYIIPMNLVNMCKCNYLLTAVIKLILTRWNYHIYIVWHLVLMDNIIIAHCLIRNLKSGQTC